MTRVPDLTSPSAFSPLGGIAARHTDHRLVAHQCAVAHWCATRRWSVCCAAMLPRGEKARGDVMAGTHVILMSACRAPGWHSWIYGIRMVFPVPAPQAWKYSPAALQGRNKCAVDKSFGQWSQLLSVALLQRLFNWRFFFFLTGVFFCVKDNLFYTILNVDKFLRKERPTSPTNDDEPSTSNIVKKPKIVKRQYNEEHILGIFLVWCRSGSETRMRNLQRATF